MKIKEKPNIYNNAQRFADVTKSLIVSGNVKRAKRCLQAAENLFINGTAEIKNAISNVYLYSVTSFLDIHHCNIKGLLPNQLKKEYCKQLNTSGL